MHDYVKQTRHSGQRLSRTSAQQRKLLTNIRSKVRAIFLDPSCFIRALSDISSIASLLIKIQFSSLRKLFMPYGPAMNRQTLVKKQTLRRFERFSCSLTASGYPQTIGLPTSLLNTPHPATYNQLWKAYGINAPQPSEWTRSEAETRKLELAASSKRIARIYCRRHEYAASELHLLRALTIEEDVFGLYAIELIDTLLDLAYVYDAQRHYHLAAFVTRRQLSILEATPNIEDLTIANCLLELTKLYGKMDRLDDGEPFYRRALAIHRNCEHDQTRDPSINDLISRPCSKR